VFSLTRKTDYALVALADMAGDPSGPVSARDLAERLRLPLPVLRNILKHLSQAGLVRSTRGQQGGYRLARRPEEISLAELIEAMEGPMRLALCCGDQHGRNNGEAADCAIETSCSARGPVRKVHGLVRGLLDRITLAEIARDRVPMRIEPPDAGGCACSCAAAAPRETADAAGGRCNSSAHC
jgi:Rrf2 family protein